MITRSLVLARGDTLFVSTLTTTASAEFVAQVSHPLSLADVVGSDVGQRLFPRVERALLERHSWFRHPVPAGTYSLMLPAAGSAGRDFGRYAFAADREPAPVALVALVYLQLAVLAAVPDRLHAIWIRCREQLPYRDQRGVYQFAHLAVRWSGSLDIVFVTDLHRDSEEFAIGSCQQLS